MKVIVVERVMDPPLTRAQAEAMVAERDACLAVRRVRHLRSYLYDDGARALCIYQAPDAEVVREGLRASGKTWERVWVADQLLAPDPDDD